MTDFPFTPERRAILEGEERRVRSQAESYDDTNPKWAIEKRSYADAIASALAEIDALRSDISDLADATTEANAEIDQLKEQQITAFLYINDLQAQLRRATGYYGEPKAIKEIRSAIKEFSHD